MASVTKTPSTSSAPSGGFLERMKKREQEKSVVAKKRSQNALFTTGPRPFAEGASGKIYEARHPTIPGRLIMKVSRDSLGDDELRREALFLRALQPYIPYVPKIHDCFDLPSGRKALVADQVAPSNMVSFMEGSTVSPGAMHAKWREIISVAFQSQRLLAILRRPGIEIVHGDIKLPNMFYVSRTGIWTLIDFGIAEKLDSKKSVRLIQTLDVRAPEVAASFPHDCSADTWSMGCVLAKLATRRGVVELSRHDPEPTQIQRYWEQVTDLIGDPPDDLLKVGRATYEQMRKISSKGPQKSCASDLRERSRKEWPESLWPETDLLADLAARMLTYKDRISSAEALSHPLFNNYQYFEIEHREGEGELYIHRNTGLSGDEPVFAEEEPLLKVDLRTHPSRTHHMLPRAANNWYALTMCSPEGEEWSRKRYEIPAAAHVALSKSGFRVGLLRV